MRRTRGAQPLPESPGNSPTPSRTLAHPCAPGPDGAGRGETRPLIGCCVLGAGRVGDARPRRCSGCFPPCRTWRARSAPLCCAAAAGPLSLSLGRGSPPLLRATVGVKVKSTTRMDTTEWPATCGRNCPRGRRRSLKRARCSRRRRTGLPFCPINAMVSSRRRRAAKPRLACGRCRSSRFSARCCLPSSSLSFSPSPT